MQGRGVVVFIVETDGHVSNVRLEQSLYPLLDAIVMRVVRDMPTWKPDKKDGNPVRFSMKVPFNFRLQ
ncbi:energy transducer TonB [uncultured Butyricimonas sp.]|uniref:energy transducer TonB n=1 Tax=uncultured Butyricimonas sp. TaxID=1268785 RepID=UPI0034C62957